MSTVIEKTKIIKEFEANTQNLYSNQEVQIYDVDNEIVNFLKYSNFPLEKLKFYTKIMYNRILFGTANRSLSIKTNDSCILSRDGRFGSIKSIFLYEDMYKCVVNIYSPALTLALASELCNYIRSYTISDSFEIFDFDDVESKCFEIVSDNKILVIKPPNNFEKD